MEEHLHCLNHMFSIQIFAFVLMSNHYHLIAKAPEANLSDSMQFFNGSTSRELQKKSGRKNQIWGSRYFRSRLGSHWNYLNCYKYIYRNPVSAGIAALVQDYEFSTLFGLLGKRKLFIPLTPDDTLFEGGIERTLEWLNTEPSKVAYDSVKIALKKKDFKLPKINQRKNPWENSLI